MTSFLGGRHEHGGEEEGEHEHEEEVIDAFALTQVGRSPRSREETKSLKYLPTWPAGIAPGCAGILPSRPGFQGLIRPRMTPARVATPGFMGRI